MHASLAFVLSDTFDEIGTISKVEVVNAVDQASFYDANFYPDRNYRLNSYRCQVPRLSFRHMAPGHVSMCADANVPPANGSRGTATETLVERAVLPAAELARVPEAGKLQMIR